MCYPSHTIQNKTTKYVLRKYINISDKKKNSLKMLFSIDFPNPNRSKQGVENGLF